MSSLSIGEVARRSGKAASAIRRYESIGLLPPAQRESRRRFAGGEPLRAIAARRLAALEAQRTWLAHAADRTCVDLADCALFA